MVKTQIIRKDKEPVAVVLDYSEYIRLKEIEQEAEDYRSALAVKRARPLSCYRFRADTISSVSDNAVLGEASRRRLAYEQISGRFTKRQGRLKTVRSCQFGVEPR